ncbi:hypothetical protein MTQ01_20865 [Streptomyces sp. XM4193]|uniref:hypothetical protein n=1 Tax=Streptomyces sp. XM4193 TaxID=2929782 RepID=UPI001FF74DEF|nr:hypothetical protein [Streptomyces sp. XM4193]MCK1798433.1 hypothetical protein [Streptomyces sp. XM4193]
MTMAIYFPGRRTLREESYLEGKAEGVTEGKAEGVVAGRAEGVAVAVLRVLERRGVSVSEGVRSRVTGCADPELLDLWLDRAFVVAAGEEIFLDEE